MTTSTLIDTVNACDVDILRQLGEQMVGAVVEFDDGALPYTIN